MTKQLIMLDASAIKLSSCSRRLYLSVVKGYRSKVNGNDTEFGSAVHKFRAAFRQEPNYGPAIHAATVYWETHPMYVKPQKKYLTKQHLHNVCLQYGTDILEKDNIKPLVNPVDGKALLEHRFAIEFYVDDNVEVLMCGTMDEIAKINNGAYVIQDLKTTSAYDVDDYLDSYRLSPQLLFYRTAVRRLAKKYPDSFWSDLNSQQIGCMIDGIFLKGKDVIEFKRSRPYFFTEGDIDEFELMLDTLLHKTILPHYRGLPPREGVINGACTNYGKCPFFYICAAPDAIARDMMLSSQFKQEDYNPMKFGE